jgi:hypothetical protein
MIVRRCLRARRMSTSFDMTTTEGVIACYRQIFAGLPAHELDGYLRMAPFVAAREHIKLERMDTARDYAGILANKHLHPFYANHINQTAKVLPWNLLTDSDPAAVSLRDQVFSARDAPGPDALPAVSLQDALAKNAHARDQADY